MPEMHNRQPARDRDSGHKLERGGSGPEAKRASIKDCKGLKPRVGGSQTRAGTQRPGWM